MAEGNLKGNIMSWTFWGPDIDSIMLSEHCLGEHLEPYTDILDIFQQCELEGCPERYTNLNVECVSDSDAQTMTCGSATDDHKLVVTKGTLECFFHSVTDYSGKTSYRFHGFDFFGSVELSGKSYGNWVPLVLEDYPDGETSTLTHNESCSHYYKEFDIDSIKLFVGDINGNGSEDIFAIFCSSAKDSLNCAGFIFFAQEEKAEHKIVHSSFDQNGQCMGAYFEPWGDLGEDVEVIEEVAGDHTPGPIPQPGDSGCSSSPTARPSCIRYDGACLGDVIWDALFGD